jgi:hypothetical protein
MYTSSLNDNPDKYCPILLTIYTIDNPPLVLPCRHTFSKYGITQWTQSHRTCPICRADIPNQEFPVDYAIFSKIINVPTLLKSLRKRILKKLKKKLVFNRLVKGTQVGGLLLSLGSAVASFFVKSDHGQTVCKTLTGVGNLVTNTATLIEGIYGLMEDDEFLQMVTEHNKLQCFVGANMQKYPVKPDPEVTKIAMGVGCARLVANASAIYSELKHLYKLNLTQLCETEHCTSIFSGCVQVFNTLVGIVGWAHSESKMQDEIQKLATALGDGEDADDMEQEMK